MGEKTNHLGRAGVAALLAAIFVLDLQLPLGIAGGVPYVLPVLLAQRLLSGRASILTAIISTLLIGVGWHLSAPAADGWMVATNRALAVFAVWVTAWLGGRVHSAERAARKARQETEPLLEQIVARVQEVFYFLEAGTGRMLFANKAYERIWQRKLESLLANPTDWIEAIHPDDIERVEHSFERMIAGNPFDEVYRIVLPSGEIRWIHDRGNPIVGDDGQVAHMAGIAEDITARREAEESLRISEERLKQIVTHVKDVFWLGDVRTRKVLYVSRAFEEIWGVAVADVLECFDLWMEKIHEEDRPRVAAAIDVFFQGAPYRETYRVVRDDGSIRWITDAGQVINDNEGKPYHLAGVARDITEQWETEQALRESEERLSQVVNQIGEVFWLSDTQGNILYVSPAYEGVWGRPSEGVYRNSTEWLMSVHPDDRARVAAEYARGLAGEGFNTEFRLEQPGGSMRWISCRSSAIYDENGRMIRMAGVAEDITLRKNEEIARLKIEEGMRRAQRLESLGVLAGGLAHDFNNLLGAIQINVEHGLKNLSDEEKVRHVLTQVQGAATRAATLTNQMLVYAQQQEVRHTQFSLGEAAIELGGLLRATISRKTDLQMEMEEKDLCIDADPAQIQQVIMNLIINASEAVGDRGGRIVVRCDRRVWSGEELRDFQVGADLASGEYVSLEVADSGCGMDAQTLEHIFDPFFTTKFQGRGLGLAGVVGTVTAHAGAIHVTSAPGEGTTFTVLLPPCAETHEETAAAQAPAEGLWRGSGTILVVDDEEMIRDSTILLLEELGYETLSASDGLSGVQVFAENRGAITGVLLDLTLPGLAGTEVFERIRAIDPAMPVVLTTGYTAGDVADVLQHEHVAFLHKPFGLKELVEVMRELG